MTIETTTPVAVPMWNGATLYVHIPCTRDLKTGEVTISQAQELEGEQRIEKAVLEYENTTK